MFACLLLTGRSWDEVGITTLCSIVLVVSGEEVPSCAKLAKLAFISVSLHWRRIIKVRGATSIKCGARVLAAKKMR